uniref:Uncharacterized protein n=1 Tax=Anguilla anguilla TaxID=7936 RepID=A0A0E9RNX6_ANGAN
MYFYQLWCQEESGLVCRGFCVWSFGPSVFMTVLLLCYRAHTQFNADRRCFFQNKKCHPFSTARLN